MSQTQNQAILAHLEHGGTLTPLEALNLCGSLRLSGRVLELRQAGWAIVTDMVKVGDKRVARYRLAA
jgi:hypothetical protein